MSVEAVKSDMARVLAELLDLALADDWSAGEPTMALLWEAGDDPDGVRIAVKRLEAGVAEELEPLAGDPYLAVAHSVVTRRPPPALLRPGGDVPVRVMVAVAHASQSGVVRHRNGATEWFGAVDLPVIDIVRALLRFEPARRAA